MKNTPDFSMMPMYVIGAFLFGRLLGKVPDDWTDFWTMLAALGTIAATWAAVWISLKDDLRKKKDAEFMGRLAAAGSIGRLVELHTFVARTGGIAVEKLRNQADPTYVDFREIHSRLKSGERKIKEIDAAAFVSLPNGVAYRLADAADSVIAALDHLEVNRVEWSPNGRDWERRYAFTRVADLCKQASVHLITATNTMIDVTKHLPKGAFTDKPADSLDWQDPHD